MFVSKHQVVFVTRQKFYKSNAKMLKKLKIEPMSTPLDLTKFETGRTQHVRGQVDVTLLCN